MAKFGAKNYIEVRERQGSGARLDPEGNVVNARHLGWLICHDEIRTLYRLSHVRG